MKNYSESDLKRMMAEMNETQARLEEVFSAGNAPDSAAAVAAVDAAHLHIDKGFYECSLQFHVNLTR